MTFKKVVRIIWVFGEAVFVNQLSTAIEVCHNNDIFCFLDSIMIFMIIYIDLRILHELYLPLVDLDDIVKILQNILLLLLLVLQRILLKPIPSFVLTLIIRIARLIGLLDFVFFRHLIGLFLVYIVCKESFLWAFVRCWLWILLLFFIIGGSILGKLIRIFLRCSFWQIRVTWFLLPKVEREAVLVNESIRLG